MCCTSTLNVGFKNLSEMLNLTFFVINTLWNSNESDTARPHIYECNQETSDNKIIWVNAENLYVGEIIRYMNCPKNDAGLFYYFL